MTDFAATAMAELRQRRTNAAQAVARGLPLPTANAAIARWCSIAAWFGAALPDELRVPTIQIYPVPAEQRQASRPPLGQKKLGRAGDISTGAPTPPQADGITPDGMTPTWWDHAPPRTSARDWLRTIAQQLREDALAQLTRAEADPTRIPRARALLALDRRLSVAAGLPPIGADETERNAA